MHIKDVLQDIVKNIPTASIPTQYINAVKLKDQNGNLTVIKERARLNQFFRDPSKYDAVETRLVIDSEAIHKSILNEVDYVFEQVEKLQRERFQ